MLQIFVNQAACIVCVDRKGSPVSYVARTEIESKTESFNPLAVISIKVRVL